ADVAPPASRPSPFDSAFRAAGAEFHVPPALLAGLGWVETRWQMVEGAEEFPGRAPAFGDMALRGATLERGAALAGVSVEAAGRRFDRGDPPGDHPHLREQLHELLELARESRLAGQRPLRGERGRQRHLPARARAEPRVAHRGAVRLHAEPAPRLLAQRGAEQ